MNALKAQITEIFSSVQGEGIFVGARQIFVRFKRCNMACEFCDTPNEGTAKEYSSTVLMYEIKALDGSNGPHHSVSLTGGEPLVYAEFLKSTLPLLKKAGFKSYLETNGTLPDSLESVIDFIDIVAMDFKLPSSTGGRAYWKEHLEFLKIAARKKVFVKSVVTTDTKKEDIEKAVRLIRTVNKKIPFIMQPATPVKDFDKRPGENRLLEFLDIALKEKIENSRVIPQVHKILGVK
ncbi:MAG: 7-carboxy-7-deazaguanine synthase QueE [Candidatus Omnitrophica bacterium]|nr:7-carboxy-7-deazaguanine synthase QueE [Candidatus Omnitrophota bacterium]